LLMLKLTPQFRHFASTLPGLGNDDTILKNPQTITCFWWNNKVWQGTGAWHFSWYRIWTPEFPGMRDYQKEFTKGTMIKKSQSAKVNLFFKCKPGGTTNPGVRVG
jgi:hypothetical protein